MHWRVKGLVQKVLGTIPLGDWAHYLLQRRLGNLNDVSGEVRIKLDDWRIMAGHLADAGRSIAGARLVEIGTGWYPTFPLAFYLGGAAKIVTFDLTRHIKADLTLGCAAFLGGHLDLLASACGVPASEVGDRYRRLMDRLDDRLDLTGATDGVIEYRAPADAQQTGLSDGSIDCVFSNSVLEHIPFEVIDGIFQEAIRILPPGGMMFHSVNCGDHYAYVDKSISQLHYLRYSDADWRFWQNRFLYQNRMRAQQFVELAERAGFAIALNTARPSERRLRELAEVPVHGSFARFTTEQLCITSIDFIARKEALGSLASPSPQSPSRSI